MQTTKASGKHNAGEVCMKCHDGNGGAPLWTAAGTLYSAATGGTAVAGATVVVIDADGKEERMVTARNGNFWTETKLRYPLRVTVSSCPNIVKMTATVPAPGACNAAGCHDSKMRLHLP